MPQQMLQQVTSCFLKALLVFHEHLHGALGLAVEPDGELYSRHPVKRGPFSQLTGLELSGLNSDYLCEL